MAIVIFEPGDSAEVDDDYNAGDLSSVYVTLITEVRPNVWLCRGDTFDGRIDHEAEVETQYLRLTDKGRNQ